MSLLTSSEVANFTKTMDPHRPITAAIATPLGSERVVSFNFRRLIKVLQMSESIAGNAHGYNKFQPVQRLVRECWSNKNDL